MKNIWLVGHAETDFDTQRIIQGNSDSPIIRKGYKQARCLAKYFESKDVDVIYSSDLKYSGRVAR